MIFREFRIGDVMTFPVITLQATEALPTVQQLMKLRCIRHLPVVERGKLVGLITHRDVLAAQVSFLQRLSPEEVRALHASVRVDSIMKRNVTSVRQDDNLAEAISLMTEHNYGCLPVVRDDGELIGIVTEADIVVLAQEMLRRTRSRIPTDKMRAANGEA